MNQSFKVLFILKKGKRSNLKSLPIYVRVTIDGQRVEWSVQRSTEPGSKWNQATGRANGTKEGVKNLNAYLDAIQGNIYSLQKEYTLRSEAITAEQLRAIILHKSQEEMYTVVQVYKYHNDQFQKIVGLEFANGTFKKFKSALKSIEMFIKWKFNKSDVYLSEVNHQIYNGL